jgi:hypothetical protein
MRKAVKQNIAEQRYDAQVYDETQKYIYQLIAMDCFLKFKESESYQQYTGKHSLFKMRKHAIIFSNLDHVRSKKEKRATDSQENLLIYIKTLKSSKSEKKLKPQYLSLCNQKSYSQRLIAKDNCKSNNTTSNDNNTSKNNSSNNNNNNNNNNQSSLVSIKKNLWSALTQYN